jgi:hypothetical protein
MAKPVLLVTRKLPEAIETRAARDYDTRLNPQDTPWARLGAEIVRRAREASAAGVLGAPADRFDAACVNALPPSVKIIANFSVGYDHIDTAAAKALGIVVANTPEVLSFASAECAFTLNSCRCDVIDFSDHGTPAPPQQAKDADRMRQPCPRTPVHYLTGPYREEREGSRRGATTG